jgi:2-amino-4-hydroxy-6-hydroxymethyldihydropteridine diphosphokinase
MQYDAWRPTMEAIRREFGYDASRDLEAAVLLRTMVPATSRFRDLGVQVRNRANLVVAGAGPSLEAAPPAVFRDKVVVACDGATARLRELGVVPHLVVTDLDGEPEALAWAAALGSHMVAHAHGDNMPALRALVPRLGAVYGTHQVEPSPALAPLENVGGFTDGDRAVLLCEHLGARAALLVGFDFDAEPSRYSHKWDPATKGAKLGWARRIVEACHARGRMAVRQWTSLAAHSR